ncbi:hypothetical protein [Bacillus toyonensis]|uniref:hypothetical protein n=1 Tax=Bacillus toyonensis TaxID=155322 RepID=UPI001C0AEEDF|nr:hypothetical protein [Bacillus toyonensis]MBU4643213.1 hypothetical protein [Bacillus toyonensis]
MNEMYQIQFAKKQPFDDMVKFLKKNKAKPGKELSLLEAERVIQQFHQEHNMSSVVVVTIDSEELEYTYDFSLRVEENQSFSLLEAFEEVLAEDGETDRAVMIRKGLVQTYQMEQNPPQKTGFFQKLFGSGKKKQEESSVASDGLEVAATTPELADFDEQTKFDDEAIDNELDALDKEIDEVSGEEDEEDEEEYDETEADLPFEVTKDEKSENTIQEEPKIEKNQLEKRVSHSEITFMDYNEYLNLQEVEKKKVRYDGRFTEEYLLSLLGLGKETEMTPLKQRQVQYAKQILNSKRFILIQDHYYQELANATDEQRLFLEQEYKKAILRDFEKEAKEELQPVFASLLQKMVIEKSQYKESEEKEIQQKQAVFKEKQNLALETFKLEQETSYQTFSSQLEERKNTLIQANKDGLQKDMELQKKKMVSDKVYELKRNAHTDLVDKRNATLSQHVNTIESLMNEAFGLQQQELKEIELQMKEQTPNWLQEIKNEKEANLHEKELQIKQKELSLEEKKFLEKSKGTVTEKEMQIADLQERLKKSNQKLEELEMKMQPNMGFNPMYQQQPMYHPAQQPMYMPVQQVPGESGIQPVKKRKGLIGWLFN